MAEKGGICGVVWHFVTFPVVIVKFEVLEGGGKKGFRVLGSGGSPQRARRSQSRRDSRSPPDRLQGRGEGESPGSTKETPNQPWFIKVRPRLVS